MYGLGDAVGHRVRECWALVNEASQLGSGLQGRAPSYKPMVGGRGWKPNTATLTPGREVGNIS